MNTEQYNEQYDEEMRVFYDVISNDIEAIRSILSIRRGPRSYNELSHRIQLLYDTSDLYRRYRELNIPNRCYRSVSDTQYYQSLLKKKMGIYKRLIRKLSTSI